MSRLPRPDHTLPHLADVVPSVLSAMGVSGFEGRISLPVEIAGACVLLIDGLGAELLDQYAADAPVLAGLRGARLQVGFPATTAAGLAAVGTGRCSGEHGLVGYSFRLPEAGVINALRWRPHPWGDDLRDEVVPEQIQPLPTTFEQAVAAGLSVRVISGAEFARSGLTRAVLRGGRYVGANTVAELVDAIPTAVAAGGFCYAYYSELDISGHVHGPGSDPWRTQLRAVDRLVEAVVSELPGGGLLAVVADHGMVTADADQSIDIDDTPALNAGVDAIGGEPRARHVYVAPGARDDVLATWREVLGDRAWVAERDEAVEAGWFGATVRDEVRPRIGEIVAAARNSTVLLRRSVEPLESGLIGHHGSLTSAEQAVPLLLAHG